MSIRTIVVIEDEPLQRADIIDVLEAAGLTAIGFGDGEQGLDYIRDNRRSVSAVFTDVQLSTERTGLEIARTVTENFSEIVVVVTSGQFLERPDVLGEKVRFLIKPWIAIDVINAIIDAGQDD